MQIKYAITKCILIIGLFSSLASTGTAVAGPLQWIRNACQAIQWQLEGWKQPQPLSHLDSDFFDGVPSKFVAAKEGRENEGLYKIATTRGPAIIKLLSKVRFTEIAEIHALFSANNFAPEIFGVVNKQTLETIGIRDLPKNLTGGFVIKVLPEVWAPKGAGPLPDFVKKLDTSKIISQIEAIERFIVANQFTPEDFQVLVTPDSRVYVIDFDLFRQTNSLSNWEKRERIWHFQTVRKEIEQGIDDALQGKKYKYL